MLNQTLQTEILEIIETKYALEAAAKKGNHPNLATSHNSEALVDKASDGKIVKAQQKNFLFCVHAKYCISSNLEG